MPKVNLYTILFSNPLLQRGAREISDAVQKINERIRVTTDINSARMALATKFDEINWDDIPHPPADLDRQPELN